MPDQTDKTTTRRCTCWLGRPGATCGDSSEREACGVHGTPTPPATDEMLAELDRLHAAATPGNLRMHAVDPRAMDNDGTVADFEMLSSRRTREQMHANARQYVALRNAYPSLRSRLAEAEQTIERLKVALDAADVGKLCSQLNVYDPSKLTQAIRDQQATIDRLTREGEEARKIVEDLAAWDKKNPKGTIYPFGPNDPEKQLDALCERAAFASKTETTRR